MSRRLAESIFAWADQKQVFCLEHTNAYTCLCVAASAPVAQKSNICVLVRVCLRVLVCFCLSVCLSALSASVFPSVSISASVPAVHVPVCARICVKRVMSHTGILASGIDPNDWPRYICALAKATEKSNSDSKNGRWSQLLDQASVRITNC